MSYVFNSYVAIAVSEIHHQNRYVKQYISKKMQFVFGYLQCFLSRLFNSLCRFFPDKAASLADSLLNELLQVIALLDN